MLLEFVFHFWLFWYLVHVFRLHYTWIDIGTPNVSFLVALDVGSDLLWVPCNCIQCAPLSAGYYSSLVWQSSSIVLVRYVNIYVNDHLALRCQVFCFILIKNSVCSFHSLLHRSCLEVEKSYLWVSYLGKTERLFFTWNRLLIKLKEKESKRIVLKKFLW